jgi:choline dehydrogenase-like flavoprotein
VPERFDAIVVGSGATGGWAAKELTEKGLSVMLLEAGPELPFAERVAEGPQPEEAPRQQVQARCYAFNEATSELFVDDVDNPYAHPAELPFAWIRSRQVGGRLHLWGQMCPRMSDLDFKAASRDGAGEDWPISYADLAPHYDRVERFMQVCGSAEGLPQVPDGSFASAPRLSPGERHFKSTVEARWPARRVTGARIALARGNATLAAARASGRLTLRPDSVVSRVLLGDEARARGVAFVDRLSGVEHEVEARAVVLCASTIESTRLLLNSSTPAHPQGLANSSGTLGRYLMDHTFGLGFDGFLTQPVVAPGEGSTHGCLLPSFRNVGEESEELGFLRGYGVELQVYAPTASRLGRLRARGRQLPGHFWMRTFGEALPRFDNQVTVDPERTDTWGVPIASVVCRYGENEAKMAADQRHTLREMVDAAGIEVEREYLELAPPGLSIHEMGTARMGADPASSVLDPHNRAWDVPNLYVTDGACFVSGGFQNPTLTMMALTVRACDDIAARMSAGDL